MSKHLENSLPIVICLRKTWSSCRSAIL